MLWLHWTWLVMTMPLTRSPLAQIKDTVIACTCLLWFLKFEDYSHTIEARDWSHTDQASKAFIWRPCQLTHRNFIYANYKGYKVVCEHLLWCESSAWCNLVSTTDTCVDDEFLPHSSRQHCLNKDCLNGSQNYQSHWLLVTHSNNLPLNLKPNYSCLFRLNWLWAIRDIDKVLWVYFSFLPVSCCLFACYIFVSSLQADDCV